MKNKMMNGVFTYNDESYNFDFNTSLSAHDKSLFVNTVVGNLVDDRSYDVINRDLIFDFVIIAMFTNIDTSFINMKDDDGEIIDPIILVEHFLKETNVVDVVKVNMEPNLLDELNRAVDLNIQYLTGIHINSFNDALAKLVNTLEKKINEIDLGGASKLVDIISNMDGDFNLENISENIVKAYINSDVAKKNAAEVKEIKESRKNEKAKVDNAE